MIRPNYLDRDMTVEEFVNITNMARRVHKNKWIAGTCTVEGKYVELKAYGTWTQIFRVDGIDNSGCADIKVSKFLEVLRAPFIKQEITQ